jgi:hypothetical protein
VVDADTELMVRGLAVGSCLHFLLFPFFEMRFFAAKKALIPLDNDRFYEDKSEIQSTWRGPIPKSAIA